MRAYLVRQTSDAAAAGRVARHLKSCQLGQVEIWRSKDAEAVKTAEAYSAQVGKDGSMSDREELANAASATSVADRVKALDHDVMVVAQQPVLHGLTAALIKHSDPKVFREMPAGGYWIVEPDKSGAWHVTATCAPEQVAS